MNADVAVPATEVIAALVAGIADRGYAVARAALPSAIIEELRERALALDGSAP